MSSSKNKFKFLVAILFTFTLATTVLLLTSKGTESVFFSRANDEEFTIVLDNENAVYSPGTIVQKTYQRNNNVSFSYSNIGSYSSGHTRLNAGGSLKNISQITSISSICATFETEGSMRLRHRTMSSARYRNPATSSSNGNGGR